MNGEFTATPVLAAAAALGEGALWDPRCRAWWWVDIIGRMLHRFDGVADECWPMPSEISTVVPHAAGGVLVALRDRLQIFRDGRLAEVVAVANHPGQRFNDGKCDAAGRLWVGTLAFDFTPGAAQLYRCDARGLVQQLAGVTISNGLCWSAAGRTMYYADTPTQRVDAFVYDPANGDIGERSTVSRTQRPAGSSAVP